MSWWTAPTLPGIRRCVDRAMPTSGGPGGENCWVRRFVRFYARGSPRQKSRPRRNGCSAWLHSMKEVPESTAGGEGKTRRGHCFSLGLGAGCGCGAEAEVGRQRRRPGAPVADLAGAGLGQVGDVEQAEGALVGRLERALVD